MMARQLIKRSDKDIAQSESNSAALSRLLIAGGDSRLRLDPTNSLNRYGCSPLPQPNAVSFSSSTASSISERACTAVEKALENMQFNGQFYEVDSFIEEMRSKLKTVWGIGDEADIIFAPSGTDAELRALFLAKCSLKPPIVSIVVGSDETGSGMAFAAAGRHFDSETANKFQVAKGERIHGLAHGIEAISIPIRKADGCARLPREVDRDIIETVKAEIAGGKNVILHVMTHSKLGSFAPTPECVQQIRDAWRGSVQIIDDACQTRVSRARVRSSLAQGRIVLITGSKFFTGPAFSGAVLVPVTLSERAAASSEVPMGLLKYSCASDWPRCFDHLRAMLPPIPNLGQALRWAAAIEEMETYFSVPPEFRSLALCEFSTFVRNCIGDQPSLQLVESHGLGRDIDEEFAAPTVFPFLLTRKGQPCSVNQARLLYRAMSEDLTSVAHMSAPSRRWGLSRRCHLGQPVEIPQIASTNAGALRVSADARLVSDSWLSGSAESATHRLRSRLDTLRFVFDKLQFLLDNFDALHNRKLPGRVCSA